jgi:slime mold repeat-containing protein
LRNSVATGDGAFVGVPLGVTVTVGTGAIAVLHEDQAITLNTAGTAADNLRNGSGRIVSTSADLGCVALAMDREHTVQDPAVCPTCQPPSFTTLPTVTQCSQASCDDGNPCTVDGCDVTGACTHVKAPDGTPCDDGNRCTMQDACNAGVCSGTPVVCGADTPCDQGAACDPRTGQCGAIPPVSMCIPGGGKPATDCAAEWVVVNPNNPRGVNSNVQLCKQGDPLCDFDIDPQQCTFHVRICLDNHDLRLPSCQPGAVSTYELLSPPPRSAAAQTMLTAVGALAPSSRSGKRQNRVSFNPPDATASNCTPVLPVRVRLAHPVVVQVQATSPTRIRDRDKLRLKCVRRLRR